ncbi:hypothetical protein VW23_027840 [Devosia insulae DS-56]|uniref:CopG family transcriptional regulator n=1 Tax=Devosia insulae DS-56 TaxID=1116389 RepID=A0A1E5XK29_9HYPH|nr:hypothetical protein [Devosia insulae]OEO28948.1 hypothetical protein VW23_027840 [Devosia insulae DS-56]
MDQTITITVTEDEARRIEERVATGDFSSPADLVHTAVVNYIEQDGFELDDAQLRQLIAEADADVRPDMDAKEAFASVYAYIEELAAKRDAKS